MNFNKICVFLTLLLVAIMGQSEAGWLKKIGKKIVSFERLCKIYFHEMPFKYSFLLFQERVGQHTRDATIQTIAVAQQAANVAATLKG